VVEPTHLDFNPRFDVSVVYLRLIILSVIVDIPSTVRHSLIDFINLKIKSTQSFRDAHMCRIYIRIFIGVSNCICMSICVYTI
jgi:hypothetical protein